MLASVHAQRAHLYFKRQRVLGLGPPTEHLLTASVHSRLFGWVRHVHRLYDLLVLDGPTHIVAANERAVADGSDEITFGEIERILN